MLFDPSVHLNLYIYTYTHAYTTQLRRGHVCLVGIDVVDDPISEQLTSINND